MIKFENTDVVGWEPAIRGMRNPKNSWEKSDTCFGDIGCYNCENCIPGEAHCDMTKHGSGHRIGPNDYQLMLNLAKAGSVHAKYRRMIVVYVDITAPLYWWKEFDTYKVGTVANSCSTMHKIHDKEFTLDDFSHEHLAWLFKANLEQTILKLNLARNTYLYGGDMIDEWGNTQHVEPKNKTVWEQMIQLLPSSYNQKRTIMFNYEVLANIYKSRRNHKLDEWAVRFINWIKSLPYFELITCTAEKEEEKTEKDAFTVCLDALSVIDQLTDAQQEMMIHNLCARINKARGMET